MNSHRSSLKIGSIALGALAVVAGSWMVGCGPSEVGASPSSKQQAAAYIAKEAEQQKATVNPKTGKTVPPPQSIKSKVFKARAGQAD
jgi:hypothetical protein